MISSEVERTLVKSPPELWSELSNPDALARHLGEFGAIRITRVEPEHAVEWEAGDTAGTVRIKPSGWGTKVTLTATREIAAPDAPIDAEPIPEAAPEPMSNPASDLTIELETDPTPGPAPNTAAELRVEPASAPAEPHFAVEPSRRFFSRLFGGRRKRKAAEDVQEDMSSVCEPSHTQAEAADAELRSRQPMPEQPDPFAAVRKALTAERLAVADPFSMPHAVGARSPDELEIETPPGRTENISADLQAAEEVATEEVTTVLTSVLDRLGAAHHRPFSRT
jgi:hypothetical protein